MNNIKDLMMTNMMMQQMKPTTNSTTTEQVYAQLYPIICISVLNYVFDILPTITKNVSEYMKNRIAKAQTKITLSKPTTKSSIVFEKHYDTNISSVEITDALVEYISKLDSSLSLFYNKIFTVYNNNSFNLGISDIICICKKTHKDGNLSSITIELNSEKLLLSELRIVAEKIFQDYQIAKKNNLGSKKYFFNEVQDTTSTNINGPKFLRFNMTEFTTNKTLDSIFGPGLKEIRSRIDLFNKPEWYIKRGLPHTLGIMLYGPPGTGKTSSIKAIAKTTNRHIVNLQLKKNTTKRQLFELFYNENINISSDICVSCLTIPLDKRIYVLEDIDCLTDITLNRKYKKEEPIIPKSTKQPFQMTPDEYKDHMKSSPDANTDAIDLSFLLNLLDGILEIPGRVIIITSNHPEKLDPALTRPGRVDVNVKLGKCSIETLQEIFDHFYESKISYDFSVLNEIFTPADVYKSLCNNYLDHQSAYNDLIFRKEHPEPLSEEEETSDNTLLIESILEEKKEEKKEEEEEKKEEEKKEEEKKEEEKKENTITEHPPNYEIYLNHTEKTKKYEQIMDNKHDLDNFLEYRHDIIVPGSDTSPSSLEEITNIDSMYSTIDDTTSIPINNIQDTQYLFSERKAMYT